MDLLEKKKKNMRLIKTISEISSVLNSEKIEYLLTRFNVEDKAVEDLDILVKNKEFTASINALEKVDYKSYSHDHALGGRVSGVQMNLIKNDRIKIDLHSDFTWRKQRYLDLKLLWKSKQKLVVGSQKVDVPSNSNDGFLIHINTIFEKTYIKNNEYLHLKETLQSVFDDKEFDNQAEKYHWIKTWKRYKSWFKKVKWMSNSYPVFLPVSLVVFSYWEKLKTEHTIDIKSLMYYVFFRARYLFNKTLPYD